MLCSLSVACRFLWDKKTLNQKHDLVIKFSNSYSVVLCVFQTLLIKANSRSARLMPKDNFEHSSEIFLNKCKSIFALGISF